MTKDYSKELKAQLNEYDSLEEAIKLCQELIAKLKACQKIIEEIE